MHRIVGGGANYVTGWINHRTIQNKDSVILICGERGSGKSYMALRFAVALDKDFTVHERVCFTITDFLELLISDKLKKGSVVILDEIGVSFGTRDWYSMVNKAMSQTLQTFRHRNLVIFMTTPAKSLLDSHGRLLINGYIETLHIDYNRKLCRFKFFEMLSNPRTGDSYHYNLINEAGVKVLTYVIGKPSHSTLVKYENKKETFLTALNKRLLSSIKKREGLGGLTLAEEAKRLRKEDPSRSVSDIANQLNANYAYIATALRSSKG